LLRIQFKLINTLRAEKALLTIFRIDERNASAYNRLGILYAKQHSLIDAIECFEIAQSLEPSASSLAQRRTNLSMKPKITTKPHWRSNKPWQLISKLASRHIAYAKVQEKLGNDKKMIESLEKAVELDPIPQTLNILADAYERTDQIELSQ
jgi:tetratricopeptide (TPR) repeat protein